MAINRKRIHNPMILVLAGVSFIALAGYLVASSQINSIGFPLDDAWIHQTYARNLIDYRQWDFLPGKPSAGSTSPLWTLLISFGYLIKTGPFVSTFVLGWGCLFGIGLAGEVFIRSQELEKMKGIPYIGLFLVWEWHLVWAAGSGMETGLFSLVILLMFILLGMSQPRWLALGILIGVAVWIRPDAITLLGPVLFCLFMRKVSWKQAIIGVLQIIATFFPFFVLYLLFNYSMAGNWWPNTFYAKQAEYAVYQQIPFWKRFLSIAELPLIGPGILLLPGFILSVWQALKNRKWEMIGAVLWWTGYTILYALRLPVVYQHGRYLIPAMPVFFVISFIGMQYGLQYLFSKRRFFMLIGKGWVMSVLAVSIAFYWLGAVSYAQDVAIIDTEMVASAKWVAQNTPATSRVALHDIGAFGYFSQRDLVDLAGLISPEVIPFIRDEKKLAEYLDQQKIDFLVTFPGWYPELIKMGSPVFKTDGKFAPSAGGENMWVYRWQRP